MLPPIHFFGPRHHHRVNNYYFGAPMMMYPMMNPWDRMMFNIAKPFLISNMITNFGNSIANIIRGGKSSQSCNCNNNTMLYANNTYNYNDSLATSMYPYVNLSNTRQTEGKGSVESEVETTISKMEAAYKEHGITSIYKGDDGRYFAVTEDGEQLSGLSTGYLADEIGRYIKSKSASKLESKSENEEVVTKENDEKVKPDEKTIAKDGASEVTIVHKKKSKQIKKEELQEQTVKPQKYTNTTNVNYAVDKLHRGIKGDGLATVTPDHITDVLFDKNVFNKDSAVSILTSYQQKYGKELFEDIDSENFYFSKSKVEDYQKIMKVLAERAKETVKDDKQLKLINGFYIKLSKNNSYTRYGNWVSNYPLSFNNDIDTFKQIMKILRNAEPKN